jgi:hypothetical protein
MTLTSDQAKMLQSGNPIPITIDHTPCVLVRQDVFDKLRTAEYDDSVWTDDELSVLAASTLAALDRPEPIQ